MRLRQGIRPKNEVSPHWFVSGTYDGEKDSNVIRILKRIIILRLKNAGPGRPESNRIATRL